MHTSSSSSSYLFDNETFTIASTIRTTKKYYVANPFDSWYIGGLLFMVTVILVLLYANFYHENSFQILWTQLLIKLHIIQPSSLRNRSSHAVINGVLL
ncbi:unnamed protein product [Rotaria sp. Silwood1]|nr:unnamed protein product [Rotaria sp. Silwood1]CAF1161681.1 unnamed protein product [Rotaria sp. Silwood1]CAF1166158.1 unnamed protein product [Rotaria sp. Silwood1]CAF3432721.1 unnamed protein product [Rotaria sp. Silwood1]CAF3458307.1 unnamed protein product [Rotaria sp. Silwood1]